MCGYGEYYNKKLQELFLGYFENNIKFGFGVLRNFKKNSIYIGEFRHGKKDGIFRVFFQNKESFVKYQKDREITPDEGKNDQYNNNYKIDEKLKQKIPYFTKSLKELKELFELERIKCI